MDTVILLVLFSWILLSLVLGYVGIKKKLGFYDPFFISMILSPILGALIVFRGDL